MVKLYDILESNHIFDQVIEAIPKSEYKQIIEGVQDCSDAIYTYKNSLMGILEMVGQDYSQLNFDAEAIREKMADPENLAVLKDVMAKMA